MTDYQPPSVSPREVLRKLASAASQITPEPTEADRLRARITELEADLHAADQTARIYHRRARRAQMSLIRWRARAEAAEHDRGSFRRAWLESVRECAELRERIAAQEVQENLQDLDRVRDAVSCPTCGGVL